MPHSGKVDIAGPVSVGRAYGGNAGCPRGGPIADNPQQTDAPADSRSTSIRPTWATWRGTGRRTNSSRPLAAPAQALSRPGATTTATAAANPETTIIGAQHARRTHRCTTEVRR